jgi:hypothetical protein
MFAGMLVAGAAAVVASASTLAALARAAGWVAWTPWLLPAALDVAGAAAGWCWLRPGAPDPARRFGRVVAIVGALGTLVGNGCGHLVASRYLVPGPVLVVVVGAVPAAVLVALAHLTALLAAGGVTQVTAEASGVAAPQVPMREQSPAADTTTPAVPSPREVPAPRGVKGPRKLPTNSAPDEVIEAARDVVAKLGKTVSHRNFAAGLRAAGYGIATDRVGPLLAEVNRRRTEAEEAAA